MEKIVKQCIGIDCAKADFAVTLSVCDSEREIQHLSSRVFKNTDEGFKIFDKWITKNEQKGIPLTLVMEATGAYHEKLACFLSDSNYQFSVVLPKRAKDFSKTLTVKKITDKIASQYLATMGLEKKLEVWIKPQRTYVDLKQLTREKEQIQAQITQIKNQIEAENSGAWVSNNSLRRMTETLKLLTRQKKAVLKEVEAAIAADSDLKEKVRKITTIPGVGLLTAATVIGETDGFKKVINKKKLVSYAGYDVINHESGTSIKTKPRISKKGNKNIRKAMHMPALASIRVGNNKDLFVRIVSKTGIKMKGVVAVQRKLLVLIYTLWKNDSVYDPQYEEKKRAV